MGSTTHIRGEIRIDPPITWGLVKDSEFVPDKGDWGYPHDLRLRIVEETVETDEGTLVRRVADAVIEGGDERRAYDVVAELQQIVDRFGTGRTFTGRLDLECRDYMTQSRLKVVDGRAVLFEATLAWPEGSE